MDPILAYVKEGFLLEDKSEVEKTRRKSTRCWVFKEGKLYKRSYSRPYLLCVHPEVVEVLLEELREGICGSYTGGRSLVQKALTQGF